MIPRGAIAILSLSIGRGPERFAGVADLRHHQPKHPLGNSLPRSQRLLPQRSLFADAASNARASTSLQNLSRRFALTGAPDARTTRRGAPLAHCVRDFRSLLWPTLWNASAVRGARRMFPRTFTGVSNRSTSHRNTRTRGTDHADQDRCSSVPHLARSTELLDAAPIQATHREFLPSEEHLPSD
jgi:hypothetical protein